MSAVPSSTRARARARRRRRARAHLPRRGGAPHRRRGPRPPLRGAGAGRLRAQVALHLDRRARRGRARRGARDRRARRDRAQPRGRRDQPAGRRDRRPRGRARRSGCRPRTRRRARAPAPAGRRARTCRSGPRSQAECASAGSRVEPVPRVDADGAAAAGDACGARGDRRARAGAGHRAPRPRRGVRDRDGGASRPAWSDMVVDPPRLPRPGLLHRGAARAGPDGRAGSSAASPLPTRASARGSSGSTARGRSAPSARCCRATSVRSRTRPWRTASR